MLHVACTSCSLITSGMSAQSSKCALLSSANLLSISLIIDSKKGNSDCNTLIITCRSNFWIWSCLSTSSYSRHSFFITYFCAQKQCFTINPIVLSVYIFPECFVMLHNFSYLLESKVHLLQTSLKPFSNWAYRFKKLFCQKKRHNMFKAGECVS